MFTAQIEEFLSKASSSSTVTKLFSRSSSMRDLLDSTPDIEEIRLLPAYKHRRWISPDRGRREVR